MKSIKLWMRVVPFVLFALVILAPERAWAQCEYATADSYTSWSSDGSYLYTSVVTEGQVICSYNGMQHTYYAYNSLNGNSAWWQSEGPSANYVSLQNDQEIPISGGEDIEWDYGSEVYCPMMGYFYTTSGQIKYTISWANYDLTDSKIILGPPPRMHCTYTLDCGTKTPLCSAPQTQGFDAPYCTSYMFRVSAYIYGYCTSIVNLPSPLRVPCH